MDQIVEKIIEMEKAALVRWCKGDPAGFLEITASDVVYFDPYVGIRIDGLAGLKEYYQSIWGKVHINSFELLNPQVQMCDNLAVLTFNYVSFTDGKPDKWNCTEVYRKEGPADWKIIQNTLVLYRSVQK